MEMNQVRYFLALCDDLSFTRAAKRCGVAQPSLTRAIKNLEAEFGGSLFDRHRVNNRLTDLGILVRPDLARIERSAAEAKRKAEKFLTARSATPQSRSMEVFMRMLSVAAVTVLIFVIGLSLRPALKAITSSPAQASETIDPHALHMKIDVKSLPEQDYGGLI